MHKHKLLLLILSLCALLVVSIGLSANENELAARVNGVEITKADFYEALESEAGQFVMRQLIRDELISQKQAEHGVEIDEDEFATIYAQLLQQLGGPQGLQTFLAQNGATEQQLIDQVRWNLLVSKLSQAEVVITDEEIEEWFTEYKDFYNTPEAIRASHILVDSKEKADELLAQLEGGAEFAALAAQYSIDTGSGSQGGDLGFFEKGQMVEAFETKVFSLAIGEIGLAESEFGWHVILVTDQQEAKEAQLEDFYEEVKSGILSTKALPPAEYLRKLESDASIDILLERYQ